MKKPKHVSGVTGVTYCPHMRLWEANLYRGGKTVLRKKFKSMGDAIAARKAAEAAYANNQRIQGGHHGARSEGNE